jgi:hypothetical protein
MPKVMNQRVDKRIDTTIRQRELQDRLTDVLRGADPQEAFAAYLDGIRGELRKLLSYSSNDAHQLCGDLLGPDMPDSHAGGDAGFSHDVISTLYECTLFPPEIELRLFAQVVQAEKELTD